MTDRCIAEAGVKRGIHPHTLRCQKDSGHDGAHIWKDESARRECIWFGEAKRLEDDTRWRYGFKPTA